MTFDRDPDHLELMLEMIGHLHRRLGQATVTTRLTDCDELDLTAYRLAVIGETANKLTSELKMRHRHIAWRAMYAMRNYHRARLREHRSGAALAHGRARP